MRLLTVFFAVFLLLTGTAQAQGVDFRNFVWGVTEEDVMKFETARFYRKEGDSLLFLEQPDKFRRLITYNFKDGKLDNARWEYVELVLPNVQDVVDLYTDMKFRLSKEYGDNYIEEFFWKNKMYAGFPQFWSRAVKSRDLRMQSVWKGKDTSVILQLYYDGYVFQLFYTAEKNDPTDKRFILNLPQPAAEPVRP